MPTDFLPSTDADLSPWLTNYVTLLTANPTDYGLLAGDATAVGALNDDYQAALTLRVDPSTNSSAAVADLHDKRVAVKALVRTQARVIRAYTSITSLLLSGIGLTVADTDPTPIPAPATKPVLAVERYESNQHVLRLRDESTPTSSKKADGAWAAEIFCKVGPGAPASIADCTYLGLASKRLFIASQDPADAGKTAYYLARWTTRRGLTGPVSSQLAATIAA